MKSLTFERGEGGDVSSRLPVRSQLDVFDEEALPTQALFLCAVGLRSD